MLFYLLKLPWLWVRDKRLVGRQHLSYNARVCCGLAYPEVRRRCVLRVGLPEGLQALVKQNKDLFKFWKNPLTDSNGSKGKILLTNRRLVAASPGGREAEKGPRCVDFKITERARNRRDGVQRRWKLVFLVCHLWTAQFYWLLLIATLWCCEPLQRRHAQTHGSRFTASAPGRRCTRCSRSHCWAFTDNWNAYISPPREARQ